MKWRYGLLGLCLSGAGLSGASARKKRLICSGYDEDVAPCLDLPTCDVCEPIDCEFDSWSDWVDHGGCAQLQERSRVVKTQNNECGKPCSGELTETERLPKKECELTPVDCDLSEWENWSKCTSEEAQAFRTRTIRQMPLNGGKSCGGMLRQTKSCSSEKTPVDCIFEAWAEWTECTGSCGPGRRTRLRRVKSEAKHGGQGCQGPLVASGVCNKKPCEDKDCKLEEWSTWSSCSFGEAQQQRQRRVLTPSSGSGEACQGGLKETKGCPAEVIHDCKLSAWSEWAECDKPCDGGQSFRKRHVEEAPSNGGGCDAAHLEQTKACGSDPCEPPAESCEFSEWGDWGDCDVDCGSGSSVRERQIKSIAKHKGRGCTGPLSELKTCEAKDCNYADCKWGEWDDWSGCSCKCGGGEKRRNRNIKQSPIGLGKLCDAFDKSEMAPCNTEPCVLDCKEGKWGEWGGWSECTATCGSAFKSRTRQVETPPDTCASPLEGPLSEFVVCEGIPPCEPTTDCEVSEWGEWSDCSCTCNGIRERSRVINKFVSGDGAACSNALKELSTCNPLPGHSPSSECVAPKVDCVMSEWSSWSTCTRDCGTGQHEKTRQIKTHPAGGGAPCSAETHVTEGCNEQACDVIKCLDCEWNEWGEWGACFEDSGQRFRHRTIKQLPNSCGKPCKLAASQEIRNCTRPSPEVLVCRWTKWATEDSCEADCGPETKSRNRILGFEKSTEADLGDVDGELFHASADPQAMCTGSQLSFESCGHKACDKCEPRDCTFQSWSEWSPPSCVGLCQRHRDVELSSNECGQPCGGPLIETKRCAVVCDKPLNCVWDLWQDWSECKSATDQKRRSRRIKTIAQRDGKACEGSNLETAPCSKLPDQVDCRFSEWGDWDVCTAKCGGGTMARSRHIVRHATPGGKPCAAGYKEYAPCNTKPCAVHVNDCKFSDWEPYSGCGADNQKYRQRHVVASASGGGLPCEGHLEESETCVPEPVDCEVSDWTAYGTCDKSCGGGQQTRVRQIHTFPLNGGIPCPSVLMETTACNEALCEVTDCKVEEWGKWSSCSATCGSGQMQRSRSVVSLRQDGGKSCGGFLTETKGCVDKPCHVTDCVWDEWEDWSGCTCTCGGGHKSRTRHIKKFPSGGGKACAAIDKEELLPCNTEKCEETCTDGAWGKWSEWSACSVTCGGGTSTRTRRIATQPNHCGNPAVGPEHEVDFCNVHVGCQSDVDCEFGAWSDWSGCSATCDGVARRSRRVKKRGAGDGKYCTGPLKQTTSCNRASENEKCEPAEPVDCELEEWKAWSTCSTTCGGGTRERLRDIKVLPKAHGKACDHAPLIETEECSRTECNGPTPRDCEIGEWSDWGACSHCGDFRRRFRHVTTQPRFGGQPCAVSALKELGYCDSACDDHGYCGFEAWGDWGACSATCGAATKTRRRELVAMADASGVPASKMALMAKYSQLDAYTQTLETGHTHELLLAFGCGVLSLLALRLVGRRLLAGSGVEPRAVALAESREELMESATF